MRRRSALLALFAVVLHALAPLLANAAPGAAVDHIELCTAQGFVTVEVESGGAPAGRLPAPGHCPVCGFQTVIAIPPCVGQLPQASAFLQQALYQTVNGVQLVAERAVVLGLSGRF